MKNRFRAALALALALPLFAAAKAMPQPAAADSFEGWLDTAPTRRADVRDFEAFLVKQGVAGVLPVQQILLNDDNWSACHMDGPYSLAERTYWPHIVNTLRYIHDEIVPAIGPVRVASGYRDAGLNHCSGGATHSAHAEFYALDLTPVADGIDRGALIARVCANHARFGAAYHIGLGFYEETRFHIDSRSFRRWGPDYHAATSPCTRTVA